MVAKSLEIGDLVWAKMKGFPPWPGKIMEPPAEAKSPKAKKSQHYVYFFGSKNFAWIADENIVLHNDKLVDQYANKKRSSVYLSAVEDIVAFGKNNSKYQKQPESSTSRQSSTSDEETPPKNKSPRVNSLSKKGETKKKVPVERVSVPKKQKRTSSSLDHNGEGSHEYVSSKLLKADENFASLIANLPPNIGYSPSFDTSELPSTKGLMNFVIANYQERPPTPEFDYDSRNESLGHKTIEPTTKVIGFLGLGKIGCGIVKNLLQSGHSVVVWDTNDEKCAPFLERGAQGAGTPSDVVIKSDITFCCVSDSDAAKTLFYENFGGLKGFEGCEKGKGYVEMTSIDPLTSESIAEAIEGRGGRYLEAQFIGSVQQAIEGSLLILGAGDSSLFDECESCFQAIASDYKFVGSSVGIASKLNIIHSMLVGTVYAAVAESLALSHRMNLNQSDFLDILKFGILDSDMIIKKGRCMIERKYDTNTPLKHIQKNINFGLMLGSTVEQPLPITAAANEVYKHCKLLRYGDHDVSAIYEGTRR